MSQEIMKKQLDTSQKADLELEIPDFAAWENDLKIFSKFNPVKLDLAIESINESVKMKCPLPFIVTLCPAKIALEKIKDTDFSRQLIPMSTELPRLKMFAEEVLGFMIATKKRLGVAMELFLIIEDEIENGDLQNIINASQIEDITNQSIKGLQETFFQIDQENPGVLQKWGVRIPKVRKQSQIQTSKIGVDRSILINKLELNMLNPQNTMFQIWQKHLILTHSDKQFTTTSWQNKDSAMKVWNRTRERLAEFAADAQILPRLMENMHKKTFPIKMPAPIFIASTIRPAGFEMEADAFNLIQNHCVIAPFQNIGRWTHHSVNSEWIGFLKEDII